jgi:hypothetical protein
VNSSLIHDTDVITLTVFSLSVALTANPSSGSAPLNNVDLTATVSGSAIGTINYKFDCNVTGNPGSLIPSGGTWDYVFDGISDNPKTIIDACDYPSEGIYKAGARAERDWNGLVEEIVTITVSAAARSASLISSPYNTTMVNSILSKIQWNEDLPSGTNIKFQLRTSPNLFSWTSWMGPDGTSSSYFQSSDTNHCSKVNTTVTCNIPSGIPIGDGSSDQWIQYKVWLETAGIGTPTLLDIALNYGI